MRDDPDILVAVNVFVITLPGELTTLGPQQSKIGSMFDIQI